MPCLRFSNYAYYIGIASYTLNVFLSSTMNISECTSAMYIFRNDFIKMLLATATPRSHTQRLRVGNREKWTQAAFVGVDYYAALLTIAIVEAWCWFDGCSLHIVEHFPHNIVLCKYLQMLRIIYFPELPDRKNYATIYVM